jgi:sulfur carrier protein ThiS
MRVIFRGKIYKFDEEKMKVKELLKRMNLSPLSTIVVRGNDILTEEDVLRRDDEVRIISAISGGKGYGLHV